MVDFGRCNILSLDHGLLSHAQLSVLGKSLYWDYAVGTGDVGKTSDSRGQSGYKLRKNSREIL